MLEIEKKRKKKKNFSLPRALTTGDRIFKGDNPPSACSRVTTTEPEMTLDRTPRVFHSSFPPAREWTPQLGYASRIRQEISQRSRHHGRLKWSLKSRGSGASCTSRTPTPQLSIRTQLCGGVEEIST
ncbi:hypothetical protein ElyMa_004830300 [Elysia marginata]|uniref:Uncharacterized protein n=1 Tax=Elysia marginata TaxID=1093978 RepID=A0AAV4IRX0_9GAST|nr:hypothetical protein ElyMa_004830300 [Elysia marginata]